MSDLLLVSKVEVIIVCMDDILSLVMTLASMMTGAALSNLTGALMSGSVGLIPRIHSGSYHWVYG